MPPATDPTTHYASQVVAGKIVAGKLVRLACERHLRDLQDGAARGLHFDAPAAAKACKFFTLLRHSKGEWAGNAFELAPWQEFIVGSLFGWKRADGLRRFRTAYLEVARKNGKTTLLSGIGLLLAFFDGEAGAEVYSAATKREQAKICWGESRRMVLSTPGLRQRITPLVANLHDAKTHSKFEPLGADADSMDGLNIHGAIVDELHAHKTRAIVDVLETATGARRQPLIVYITTAGTDRQSVCYERHVYAEQVVSGVAQDDTLFAFVAALDEGDAWDDEAVWPKANPNLDVSVKRDDLQRKVERARQLPTELNAFLRLHCGVWTQQVDRWLPPELWAENSGLERHATPPTPDELAERFAGRKAYGGLDLSATRDLTAWALVLPDPDDADALDVYARFWCPEEWLHSPENRYSQQYQAWARGGFLTPTPGNSVDYATMRAQILADAERFSIADVGLDRLFEGREQARLLADEGIDVIPMGQGMLSMAAPTKELERKLLARKIRHYNNPVLAFMADSVAVTRDAADNIKPDKANSQARIDGIVALIMGIDRVLRNAESDNVYATRGLLSIND